MLRTEQTVYAMSSALHVTPNNERQTAQLDNKWRVPPIARRGNGLADYGPEDMIGDSHVEFCVST